MADQSKKQDAGKVRLHLVANELGDGAARAHGYGTAKYSRYAWMRGNGMEWSRLWDACSRHLRAWMAGEDNDPESGLSHLDHAAASLGMLMAHVNRGLGRDDRFTTDPDPDKKEPEPEPAQPERAVKGLPGLRCGVKGCPVCYRGE